MSGPKVVRIVTREEIIAICEGHLARAEAALAEWICIGRRNDSVTEAEIAAAKARLDRLRQLLTTDRFADLQKQVPQEIAFLHDDQQARLTKIAAAAAEARSAERRQAQAVGALLSALRRAGKPLDPALEESLERAASGKADPRAIAEGFALLSAGPDDKDEERRELAQRLKTGKDQRSLAEWVAAQPKPPADLALMRLERGLAELATIVGPDVSAALESRLNAVVAETSVTRRSLMLDSVEMDLGRTLAEARNRNALAEQLRLTLAELAQSGSAAHSELARKMEGADAAALTELHAEAKRVLAREREILGAAARRAAVLKSLTSLGYEVSEGLATAWVDEGRVVLRKAARPDYGVEISGDMATARVQMRAVAFTDGLAGPDPTRDKDAETLWCGDVAALQAKLTDAGGGLVIERALPVGASPLKRLLDPGRVQSREAREGPALQSRTSP